MLAAIWGCLWRLMVLNKCVIMKRMKESKMYILCIGFGWSKHYSLLRKIFKNWSKSWFFFSFFYNTQLFPPQFFHLFSFSFSFFFLFNHVKPQPIIIFLSITGDDYGVKTLKNGNNDNNLGERYSLPALDIPLLYFHLRGYEIMMDMLCVSRQPLKTQPSVWMHMVIKHPIHESVW